MVNRLRELRTINDLTLEQVAKEAGTTNQMVGMLERGDRQLTQRWMERLAPVFKVKPHELIEVISTDHRIRLEGVVQAGKWRKNEQMEVEPEYFDIPLPNAYSALHPFAVRVLGPSMNMVYPEGTILICCTLTELREDPTHGKRYIIEDVDSADGIETTVKEFFVDEKGRPWAWPRSTSPEFQTPLALDKGRPGHTIRVKARVIFSLLSE